MIPASSPAATVSLEILSPIGSAQSTKALTVVAEKPPQAYVEFGWQYMLANPVLLAGAIAASVALLVGLLTFSGVAISLWFAHKRMRQELAAAAREGIRSRDHSRQQATLDRIHSREEAVAERQHSEEQATRARLMEARRNLYSEMIEACIRMQGLIGSMPTMDLLDKEEYVTKTLSELAVAVNKTWLLSGPGTAYKIRELHSQLMELFGNVAASVRPLQGLKERIVWAQDRVRNAVAERWKIVDALDNNRIYKGDDQRIANELRGLLKVQAHIIDDCKKIVDESQEELQPKVRKVQESMLTSNAQAMLQIQLVMAACREELGLEGDSEELRQQTNEMHARAMAMFVGVVGEADPPSKAS
ncbi:hypothetical protein [Rhizobacter sp. P5_C2]